jgi:hypothetical protein
MSSQRPAFFQGHCAAEFWKKNKHLATMLPYSAYRTAVTDDKTSILKSEML